MLSDHVENGESYQSEGDDKIGFYKIAFLLLYPYHIEFSKGDDDAADGKQQFGIKVTYLPSQHFGGHKRKQNQYEPDNI